MAIDLERARRETPGCANVVHLNNAGAALMPAPVLDAVIGHLRLEGEIGGYEAHAREERRIEGAYGVVARLIGCRPDEIAFVENATRGWDMAFYAFDFQPGDRILTARAEYASNYIAYLQVARKTGAVIEAIPDDEHGRISLEALANAMDGRVRLISITHVPTNGGLVNPAAGVGRIARDAGVPFLLDACQSVGQMPIDVEAIGCDILSATGRKYLRGPRGTGFLYVRRGLLERLEPPFLDLHAATWTASDAYELRADARRFENWESFLAGRLGLAAAIEYALGWGLEAIRDRVYGLARDMRDRLAEISGVSVHDLGVERCGIVTFRVAGLAAEDVMAALAAKNINVETSSVFSTRLDMEARGPEPLVRASVHYYNSEDEITMFLSVVEEITS